MIVLVGHAFVDAGISDDVDVVSLSVGGHNSGKGHCSVLIETFLEKFSSL